MAQNWLSIIVHYDEQYILRPGTLLAGGTLIPQPKINLDAALDADGNLYFVDRTVDTIKHKGYRVSASEIESVLQEHPAVIGSCVVGVPDEKVGERIKAYVVLKEDIKGITGYDLIKWCRQTLVSYKVPHYIEFRDMLPKSKVGKLLRREIRSEEKRRTEA